MGFIRMISYQDDLLNLGDGDRVILVLQPEPHKLKHGTIRPAGAAIRGQRLMRT
jgi:hypothetical protein